MSAKSFIVFVFIMTLLLPADFVFAEEAPADFVERNLTETRRRLAELKTKERQNGGAFETGESLIDPKDIMAMLPKPHRLRFRVNYPEKKVSLSPNELNSSSSNNQLYPTGLIEFFDFFVTPYTVAADDLTSAILQLPRIIPLHVKADVVVVHEPQPDPHCCLSFDIKTDSKGNATSAGCARRGLHSMISLTPMDPRTLPETVGFNIEVSGPGGELLDKGAAVRFNEPGRGVISASFANSYKFKDFKPQRNHTCKIVSVDVVNGKYVYIPEPYIDSSGNVVQTLDGWHVPAPTKIEGKKKIFDVIGFSGLHFGGRDYRQTGMEVDSCDFFAQDSEEFKPASISLGEMFFILRGAEGERIERAAGWQEGQLIASATGSRHPAALSYHATDNGQFVISELGQALPLGAFGEAHVNMNLGNYWSLKRKLTANRWTVNLDNVMTDGYVVPGIRHRLTMRVQGPADMTKYRLRWSGGNWENPQASFVRQDQYWVAENFVRASANANFDSQLWLYIEAASDAGKQDSPKISWKRSFRLAAGISAIELQLAAKGQGLAKETLDLFFPNHLPEGNRFMIAPFYKSINGNTLESALVLHFLDTARLRLISNSPAVAKVDSGGGIIGHTVGEAWLTAELDSPDLNRGGHFVTKDNQTIISNAVKVTANQLILTRGATQAGFTPYTLVVIGPARMTEQYQATFHFENGSIGTIFTDGEGGGQTAEVLSALPVVRVEIVKGGQVVAMLPVNDTVVMPQAGIQLLPIKLPGNIIDEVDVVDMGSLTSTTQCRKNLRAEYPQHYATASDDVLNAICADLREEEKKDIKEQRVTQKAQKKILGQLKRQGRKLMVFSDSTQLGAVVTGNFDHQRMHCRWRVDNGGSLKFQQKETQIVRVGGDGSCFNNLDGFQGDFNTEAMAVVELIYAIPGGAQGQFIEGGHATPSAYTDIKAVEEWAKK